jgi:hypothetical protein
LAERWHQVDSNTQISNLCFQNLLGYHAHDCFGVMWICLTKHIREVPELSDHSDVQRRLKWRGNSFPSDHDQ